jgi:F-type H+-transporting ATPase subunit delta
MAADLRVSRRYAEALFNMAVKYDVVSSVEGDLAGIHGLLENDPRFRDFLISPHVARDEKLRIAETLFSDRVTALTMQAVRLLLEKRREREFSGVYKQFVVLRREHENMVSVVVTSAETLSEEQRDAIMKKIESALGKTVEPSYLIDTQMLGGVKVEYENTVLDGTVRGTLNKMRDRLKYDLLKQN